MSDPIAVIEKSPTRRISVTRVESVGEERVAMYEEERKGQRWAPTRHGFAIAPAQVSELIEALRLALPIPRNEE